MDAVDHVVLGAGAVGLAVAEALAARGQSVRVVSRSGLREPVVGVQSVAGDVTDPAFAASATRGARVIYQALNPPYHRWGREFPGLPVAAIAAAQAAGARLVVMDNVYMYGRADGRPFTEDRAYDAHTRKGRVRAAMARDLMAAHDAGRVQVTVGRASDFFGPRAGGQSLIGDWVIHPALADKPASVMGDPDMPHTYTFIPDIGENLVRLGERDDALGRVWHLPSPETRTTRDDMPASSRSLPAPSATTAPTAHADSAPRPRPRQASASPRNASGWNTSNDSARRNPTAASA